ncbi:MAG TPA: hypothetical protein P5246_01340 [Candidatus Omnitrophota bacterium]|nr:hypothetical protein [Candidatus Omnitrophota bacterium]HSA30545.1 hypothetical protein [Candidatus Omnitrophota bacterium]
MRFGVFQKYSLSGREAQAAFEYMILLTTVVLVVLLAFHPKKGFLIKAKNLSDEYMNYTLKETYGLPAAYNGVTFGSKGPFP